MSRKPLRFFLTEADQDRIDPSSIVIEEVEADSGQKAGFPAHHMLKISFTITNPDAGPPRLLPMFASSWHFLATSDSGAADPDPAAVVDDDANYATWRTQGILAMSNVFTDTEKVALSSTIDLTPNRAWYSPVAIPKEFLFQTLVDGPPNGIPKVAVKFDSKVVKTTNSAWLGHRVAGFLLGKSDPVFSFGATEADDDAVKFPMPTVVMNAAGEVILFVIMARKKNLQDSLEFNEGKVFQLGYDVLYGATRSLDNRLHRFPANGCVPAREVYRQLKDQFFDLTPGKALSDKILEQWPAAPRYLPIRYTRTFKAVENSSVFFLNASIAVTQVDSGAALQTRRLPAHGLLFIRQDPVSSGTQPEPPLVSLAMTSDHGCTHLVRTSDTDWRVIGTRDPVQVQLTADWTAVPQVLLRAPMWIELGLDPFVAPGGALCTYSSLRRSVRALVNNRIAGGRLLFGPSTTSSLTESLIKEAFTSTAASVSDVADGKPMVKPQTDETIDPTLTEFNRESGRLKRILQAFFPEDAGERLTKGEVAYNIWQSSMDAAASHRTAYPDAYVGRGGPGALVYLGLANAFHSNPDPAGDGSEAFLDAVVTAMLSGLKKGALLQYWWSFVADYQNVTARRNPTSSRVEAGHSPMFMEYTGSPSPTGYLVIDQFALGNSFSSCPVTGAAGSRLINWGGKEREIWLAANWFE